MHRTACKLFAAKINKTKVSRRLNTMSDLFYYATLTTTMINITSSPAQQGRGSITGGRYSTLATAAGTELARRDSSQQLGWVTSCG